MFITHVRRHEEWKKVDLKLLNAWGSRKTRETKKFDFSSDGVIHSFVTFPLLRFWNEKNRNIHTRTKIL